MMLNFRDIITAVKCFLRIKLRTGLRLKALLLCLSPTYLRHQNVLCDSPYQLIFLCWSLSDFKADGTVFSILFNEESGL